jgi:hypothetical protein
MACHEIGHAMVLLGLGVAVTKVRTCFQDGVWVGNTQPAETGHEVGALSLIDASAACLAGTEAQELLKCKRREGPSGSDYGQFLNLLSRNNVPDDQYDRYRHDAWQRARGFLAPRLDDLNEPAATLCAQGELDGESLKTLLCEKPMTEPSQSVDY